MFGFIADILTSVITVLFPIFASYKALRASDPAQLVPWLMYWCILSLLLLVESMFAFILTWIPFYSWIRFLVHFSLVMPGSHGATMLYQEHVEPFLAHHEEEIEYYISDAHEKAKSMGLAYLKLAIEWAKVNVMGMEPSPRTPPNSRNTSQNYAQQLLGKFMMPSARPSHGSGPGADLYGLVTQAISSASTFYSGSRDARAEEIQRSGTLIPDDLRGKDERMLYVNTQREGLHVLLQAYDREAMDLESEQEGRPDLPKSRSEVDFDKIDRDEASSGSGSGGRRSPAPQGSWMPWNWSGSKPLSPTSRHNPRDNMTRGKTTGADPDLAY
ncbi:hypothetical protein EJ05DRAFT_263938 [Pseudovirgaria hyperparasitica]|uniref:Protein YOP1 n=1 Tax=Pseudovirgaria hyperparasitica TaxID=470096 RepID=A0A6A6WH57_9PEZI|nr:uncharacterized protein EJ05DRAFT_263938 [Pseudovirgaria hyperparasitica]KAF2761414.1 hypothetical protein EJ05DRAFT_263938 [Pseudovirgaria hyperparasitica]